MSKKIQEIKKYIESECKNLGKAPVWFYDVHLLAVEKEAKYLLKELPKANTEIVMLGVWLHDLQRIRGIKGDHQSVGAREAGKVMGEFGYDKETIDQVKNIILTHSCGKAMPKTSEAKILASADASAHYDNDFYLEIATSGQRNVVAFKEWACEKLNRDYNHKIFFPFAKKRIKAKHEALARVFGLKKS